MINAIWVLQSISKVDVLYSMTFIECGKLIYLIISLAIAYRGLRSISVIYLPLLNDSHWVLQSISKIDISNPQNIVILLLFAGSCNPPTDCESTSNIDMLNPQYRNVIVHMELQSIQILIYQ